MRRRSAAAQGPLEVLVCTRYHSRYFSRPFFDFLYCCFASHVNSLAQVHPLRCNACPRSAAQRSSSMHISNVPLHPQYRSQTYCKHKIREGACAPSRIGVTPNLTGLRERFSAFGVESRGRKGPVRRMMQKRVRVWTFERNCERRQYRHSQHLKGRRSRCAGHWPSATAM